jgi:hypothetical protein
VQDIDSLPDGYEDELLAAEAGMALAQEILSKRQARRTAAPDGFADAGRPVYGMPGRRMVPGQGIK